MFLNDEEYEDESGRWVKRTEIDGLGTYEYLADGFFKWECICGKQHQSRGFRVGGVIWKCHDCGKKCLLIRTDFKFLNQKMKYADRSESTAELAIKDALRYFGQGIAALGRNC